MADLNEMMIDLLILLKDSIARSYLLENQFGAMETLVEALLSHIGSKPNDLDELKFWQLLAHFRLLQELIEKYLILPAGLSDVEQFLRKAIALSCIEMIQTKMNNYLDNILLNLSDSNITNEDVEGAILNLSNLNKRVSNIRSDRINLQDEFSSVLHNLRPFEDGFQVVDGMITRVEDKFVTALEQESGTAFSNFYVTSLAYSLLLELLYVKVDLNKKQVKFQKAAEHIEKCFGSFGTFKKKKCRVSIIPANLNQEELGDLTRRMEFMKSGKHSNLCEFLGMFHLDDSFHIVESLIGPSLHQVLHNKNPKAPAKRLNEEQCYAVFFGVINGLRFLHKHNIIHMALCPRNVILGKENKLGAVKLCGNLRKNYSVKDATELLPYVAPEVLFGDSWSFSADMYSFGVTLWESTQHDKFPVPNTQRVKDFVYNGQRPKSEIKLPSWIEEILRKCWSDEVPERPMAEEVYRMIKRQSDNKPDPSDCILGIFTSGNKKILRISKKKMKKQSLQEVKDLSSTLNKPPELMDEKKEGIRYHATLPKDSPQAQSVQLKRPKQEARLLQMTLMKEDKERYHETLKKSQTVSSLGMKEISPPRGTEEYHKDDESSKLQVHEGETRASVQSELPTKDLQSLKLAEELLLPEDFKNVEKTEENHEDEEIHANDNEKNAILEEKIEEEFDEDDDEDLGYDESSEGEQRPPGSPIPPPRPIWGGSGVRKATRNARSIMLMLGVKNPKPPKSLHPMGSPPPPPRPS